jgi:hypothetical protein
LNLQVWVSLNKVKIQIILGCWADPVEQDRPGHLNQPRSPPISRPVQASRETGTQHHPRPTSSPLVAEPTYRGPTWVCFRHHIYKPSTPAAKSLLPSSIFARYRAPLPPPLAAD